MPIIKSAKKAARQTVKRTAHNQQIKKDIKAALKEFKKTPTGQNLAKTQSEIDKAVKKNLLKINTAARRKAQLFKLAKQNGVKFSVTVKAETKPAKPVAKKPAAKPAAKKAAAKKTAAKTTAKKA